MTFLGQLLLTYSLFLLLTTLVLEVGAPIKTTNGIVRGYPARNRIEVSEYLEFDMPILRLANADSSHQ